MVILGLIHICHEFFHRFPVLIYDLDVIILFPDDPWNNDSGVSPTETHLIVSILGERSHSEVRSDLSLAVPHVAHPLMHEASCVGEECTGFSEDLCIRSPAKSLIALRTVSRNRQIVGIHSPQRIRNELIDQSVTGNDPSGFLFSRNRCDRDRLNRLDHHLFCRSYAHITVSEERASWSIFHIFPATGERIFQKHEIITHTEILPVTASFRAIHATRFCTISVIQDLRRKTSKNSSLSCLEDE